MNLVSTNYRLVGTLLTPISTVDIILPNGGLGQKRNYYKQLKIAGAVVMDRSLIVKGLGMNQAPIRLQAGEIQTAELWDLPKTVSA